MQSHVVYQKRLSTRCPSFETSAGGRHQLGPPAKATGKGKGDAVTESFFGFARKAVEFMPETGHLADADLDQHMRKALSAAKRQKDDAKSKMPPERREELNLALAK